MSRLADSVGSSASGLYMGRSSSRMSSNCVSAPAVAAPSSAVCRAARLFEIFASEPPRPTTVNALAIRLLLVALDDLRVADTRGAGVVPGLAERTALAEQIPALVEADLDRFEPAVFALV